GPSSVMRAHPEAERYAIEVRVQQRFRYARRCRFRSTCCLAMKIKRTAPDRVPPSSVSVTVTHGSPRYSPCQTPTKLLAADVVFASEVLAFKTSAFTRPWLKPAVIIIAIAAIT